MMRCIRGDCRRWWSVAPGELEPRCACGSLLELADFDEHLATIPYVPFDHTKK